MLKHGLRVDNMVDYKLKWNRMMYGNMLKSIMISEFNNTLQIVYILVNV